MYDVVALGELLIDFTPFKPGPMGNPTFEMNPGGAPANCLAAVSKFGGKTAMISMVGRDAFGDFLIAKLSEAGIDPSGVRRNEKVHTTLAFVHLDERGDRTFSFLRKPGADIMLEKGDVDTKLIDCCRVFHFGGLSMTDEPSREATLFAVEYAKKAGKLISYDPNFRPPLWDDLGDAVKYMKLGLEYADYVKMSEEEMAMLTGYNKTDYEKGAMQFLSMGKKAVFITLGPKGAFYACQSGSGQVDSPDVKVADTTGCGDSFTGAMLYLVVNKPEMPMEQKVRMACATGALCATKRGGIPAMPAYADVFNLAEAQN